MKLLLKDLGTAIVMTSALSLLVSVVYPMTVWSLAQLIFPHKANGSLIVRGDKVVASSLIGQGFYADRYFHPRPSAAGEGYDAAHSGGSNLGPLSRSLLEGDSMPDPGAGASPALAQRARAYRSLNGLAPDFVIPADAVTSSASGLDPHISQRNALLQAARVARARRMDRVEVRRLIEAHTQKEGFGIEGEALVHVVDLNLALDDAAREQSRP